MENSAIPSHYFMAWHGAGQPVYTLTGMTLQRFYDHLLDEIGENNRTLHCPRSPTGREAIRGELRVPD